MVVLLLFACPVYLAIGETSDAITAAAAVIPIIAIAWYLEGKAARGVARLQELSAPTATVTRDGAEMVIPARDVVVGDLVRLVEGDLVPADATLADTVRIAVNEAALTGESMPADKLAGDNVSAGTIVTAGLATAVVTATGQASALGQISALMARTRPPRTPLQRAMGRLVLRVAAVAALGTVVVVITEIVRGSGWQAAALAGISLLIAAVPEEFSMVYALYLSIGAWYLARQKALVRTLPSAESLGSVTVICTDKTGTVTEGKLRVAAMHPVTNPKSLTLSAMLASERNAYDPLDAAIAAHAETQEMADDDIYSGELLDDWPFSGNRVTRVWRVAGGQVHVACKGSLEALLALTKPNDALLTELQQAHQSMAESGLRVIAVAASVSQTNSGDRGVDESGLAMEGLIGFEDPLRAGVADAVAECLAAGIRVVMITGDHPETARAIAHQMSTTMDQVATGAQLAEADAVTREALVSQTDVFARTKPEQKFALVKALQQRGEVVAMTGDGVNDAPALRAADIGVAMGTRGTAVAREAAAMVLLEDDFATIVAAVRNGR
jgi:Ca2+-transporting ATPase